MGIRAVHTHIYRIFDHTPRLLITAPDAECGKTVLMTHMVGKLVNKPQSVELMKAAPFFRLAEALHPTYLIDEMDVFIKEDSDLLAAVNNGWEPHGGVPRCVGEDIPRSMR
jgi:putative DNA primase/helicase